MSHGTGTIVGYGKDGSDAEHGNLEQVISGRTDYRIIGHSAAARRENDMMCQRDRVCLAEGQIVAAQWRLIGGLQTERFKCIAEWRDGLFIRSGTAICH